jgi:hypothetical protein
MDLSIFDGATFNAASLVVPVLGLLVAVIALFYGHLGVFPPRHRLTVFIGRPGERPDGTVISFSNTGRYAIETTRFDRDRPVTVDVGTPIRSLDVRPAQAVRAQPVVTARGSSVVFGPDLLNPGESVSVVVGTAGAVGKPAIGHALVDTTVDRRSGRPPGPAARRVPAAIMAFFLLAPTAFILYENRDNLASYVRPAVTASVSPDHGPSGGCITVRGQHFEDEEAVNVWASVPGTVTPAAGRGGCRALNHENAVTASIGGEIYAEFALPAGLPAGPLYLIIFGDKGSESLTYWVRGA